MTSATGSAGAPSLPSGRIAGSIFAGARSSAVRHALTPIACGLVLGGCLPSARTWPLAAGALSLWAAADLASSRRRPDDVTARTASFAGGILGLHAVGQCWLLAGPRDGDASGLPWGALILAATLLLQVSWFAGCRAILLYAVRAFRPGTSTRAIAECLAWAAAWGCADALRQIGWTGNAYAQAGIAFVDAPGVPALLPIFGLTTTGALLFGAGWLVAMAVTNLRSRASWAAGAILLAGVVAFLRIGTLVDDDAPVATGRSIPVLALQTAIDKRIPFDAARLEHAQARLLSSLRSLPEGGVLITPETYFASPRTGEPSRRAFWNAFDDATTDGRRHALVGMPVVRRGSEGDPVVSNAVVEFAPGRISIYGKEQLVPGSEYVPRWLPFAGLSDRLFGRGRMLEEASPEAWRQPLFVGEDAVGVSICHELAFELLMADRAREAGWLVNVSEDGWLRSEAYRRAMRATARARALEAGLPLLRVANGGSSALIDGRGRVLASAANGQEAAALWQVDSYQGTTFHTRHAGALFLASPILALAIACAGALLALVARARDERRTREALA